MDMAKNARVALLCLNCGIVQTGNTKHCCLPQLILFVYWWEERKLKSLTPTKSALGTDDKVPPAQAGRAGSVTQTHRSFWEPAAFFSDYLPDHVCGNSRRWNASMKEACSSQPIPFCHTAAFSRYWCQKVWTDCSGSGGGRGPWRQDAGSPLQRTRGNARHWGWVASLSSVNCLFPKP